MTIEHDAVGDPLTRYASATQTEARPSALADQIMADKDGPYWDTHHRDHRATVDHVTALLIEARGNEPVIGEDAPDGLDRLIEQSMTAPEGGYDFNINLSDGEEYDDDLDANARGWFSDLGINQHEAQSLVAHWRNAGTLSDDARDARQSETRNFLQRTWGDDFAKNMSGVRTVAKTLGPTFMKFMEDTGLGDDRVVLQTLHRVALQRRSKV